MFWPQLIRGTAIMFCILPPTQLALGHLAKAAIDDASGLFNLMRNLGGAIGIALIDTVIYTRTPEYAQRIINRLGAGDLDTAREIGVPPEALTTAPLDPEKQALLASLQGCVRRRDQRRMGSRRRDDICRAGLPDARTARADTGGSGAALTRGAPTDFLRSFSWPLGPDSESRVGRRSWPRIRGADIERSRRRPRFDQSRCRR